MWLRDVLARLIAKPTADDAALRAAREQVDEMARRRRVIIEKRRDNDDRGHRE